jgi:hypothetical protein
MFTIALTAYHMVERRRINAALWAGPGGVNDGMSIADGFGADEAPGSVIRPGGKRLSESLAG